MKYMGKTVLLAATSLLLLTGCDEDARNTIEGVVEAAQAQDLDAYRSHFEGEALEAFGTEEAMNQVVEMVKNHNLDDIDSLKIDFDTYKRKRMGQEQLSCLSKTKENLELQRYSKFVVADKNEQYLFTAQIRCDLSYKPSKVYLGGRNRGWQKCQDWVRTDCVITALEMPEGQLF